MGANEAIRAADRLESLFAALAEEARLRPDFALRMQRALDGAGPASPAEAARNASFTALLHGEGEDALRRLLISVGDPVEVLRLAHDQHIPTAGIDVSAPLPAIVDAVVDGAKFRLQDRIAAFT